MPLTKPMVLVLIGVTGSGKTTVAAILAGRLGWKFEEGDALHPRANIEKMGAGHPLTDADRWPWLERVADWIAERLDAGENGLITCSALKRSYRDFINRRGSGVVFVYLAGSAETIAERLAERRGPFMPPNLPNNQFGPRWGAADQQGTVQKGRGFADRPKSAGAQLIASPARHCRHLDPHRTSDRS